MAPMSKDLYQTPLFGKGGNIAEFGNNSLGPNYAPPEIATFIDECEMLKRLPISRRALFQWRASGKIPYLRVTGRRILFHWPSVQSALLRMQQGGTL